MPKRKRLLPHEKEDVVLVPGSDHNYDAYYVAEAKVVYNPEYHMYFEYHGDHTLEEGEIVVTAKVAG